MEVGVNDKSYAERRFVNISEITFLEFVVRMMLRVGQGIGLEVVAVLLANLLNRVGRAVICLGCILRLYTKL